mgnify:CR=1 FL=1
MAIIVPDGWREMEVVGNGAQREIQTLESLADGLPDDYTVYHAVHWTGSDSIASKGAKPSASSVGAGRSSTSASTAGTAARGT